MPLEKPPITISRKTFVELNNLASVRVFGVWRPDPVKDFFIYNEPKTGVRRMCERCEELEDALRRIVQWADAYPTDIFHKPSPAEFQRAHKLLKAKGMTMDAFSADMGRHCMEGVAKIARGALFPVRGAEPLTDTAEGQGDVAGRTAGATPPTGATHA